VSLVAKGCVMMAYFFGKFSHHHHQFQMTLTLHISLQIAQEVMSVLNRYCK